MRAASLPVFALLLGAALAAATAAANARAESGHSGQNGPGATATPQPQSVPTPAPGRPSPSPSLPLPDSDPSTTPAAVNAPKAQPAAGLGEPTVSSDVTPPAVSAPTRQLRSVPLKNFPHSRAGQPLVWDDSYRRIQTSDVIFGGINGALALAAAIVPPIPRPWVGPILFDNSVRNALRLKSLDARGWAGDTSDVLLSMAVMGPFLVDSLATAWWYRGSADVAQQMALIDLETLSVTAAVQGLTTELTGRQRPYVQNCGTKDGLPVNTVECQSDSRYRSFFSGHTSITFTSAALVCSHHLNLDLFEDNPADEVSCATAELAAATTGALRIMSDNHWSTDVLTGAVVGNAVGFGMPYLLHYRRRSKEKAALSTSEHSDFTIHFVPTGLGGSAVGTF